MPSSTVGLLTGSLALVFGCGSSGGAATLDCAWLAGDNCYKTTVAEAASCLPLAAETGVLDASNTTCTYASGTIVTFTPALALPIPTNSDARQWNFTIANGGKTCLHYQETQSGLTLTVGANTVSEGSSGGLGLKVTCPGGSSYSNGNAFSLFDCGADAGGSFGGLPGSTWSSTDTSVSFGLIGTEATFGAQVFECSKS